ncbi:MAG: hypothetical protein OXU61_08330 [Gammaproteobacteria bacterium]|nr:hypothetical protein [Gammaproteobacteria bacterium]
MQKALAHGQRMEHCTGYCMNAITKQRRLSYHSPLERLSHRPPLEPLSYRPPLERLPYHPPLERLSYHSPLEGESASRGRQPEGAPVGGRRLYFRRHRPMRTARHLLIPRGARKRNSA